MYDSRFTIHDSRRNGGRTTPPTIYHLPSSGFTIVELLVTLAIFVMMTTIVLANYPSFNDKIGLEVLAQNIALSIREAQVYGISVRAENIAEAQLAPAYGIHFFGADTDLRDNVQHGRRLYMLFADYDGDKVYDGQDDRFGTECLSGTSDAAAECVQVFSITGQSEVGIICANMISDTSNGGNSAAERFQRNLDRCKLDPIAEADVVFKRPNPEATITAKTATGRTISGISDLEVFVRLTNGGTTDRMVTLWNTGQISVQACGTQSSNTATYGKCNSQ